MNKYLKIFIYSLLLMILIILFVLIFVQGNEINDIKNNINTIKEDINEIKNIKPDDVDITTTINETPTITSTVSPTNAETLTIKLYYKNEKNDPDFLNCEADTFVYRNIPKTTTPLNETLKALVSNKLTQAEKNQGLTSPFEDALSKEKIDAFKFVSVSITNKIAKITLDDPKGFTSEGSCKSSLLSSMFSLTSKQFPTVESVTFYPNTLFQP